MARSGSNFFVFDGIMAWFLGPNLEDNAEEAFEDAALDILEYAKQNAPWLDRTGMARAGLDVQVTRSNGQIILELYHTVEYGLWLEVIQNGRYATIMPTLEQYAPRVYSSVGARVTSTHSGEDYSL